MKPDFKKMELIPAIIQDYQTNEVLMLAYVNEEAYKKMSESVNPYGDGLASQRIVKIIQKEFHIVN